MRPMRRIPGGRVIDLGGEEGYYPDIYITTMNAKCANWNAGKKSWKKGNVAWNMLSACTGMDGLESDP